MPRMTKQMDTKKYCLNTLVVKYNGGNIMKKNTKYYLVLSLLILTQFTNVHAIETESDEKHAPDYNSQERIDIENEKWKEVEQHMLFKSMARAGGSNSLKVTEVKQANSYYCGPASAHMIIKYVSGKNISQNTLASNMGTVKGEGTYVYKLAAELKKQTGKNYIYSNVKDKTMTSALISNIDKGLPLVFHVKTQALNPKYTFNTGHFVVGVGYDWYAAGSSGYSNVSYIDPWYGAGIFGYRKIKTTEMDKAIRAKNGFFIW